MTARCHAKAAELTTAGTKTRLRTVERMRARLPWPGFVGFGGCAFGAGSAPTGNADERVVDAARTVIAAQTDTSTGTRKRVVDQVRVTLDEQYGRRRGRVAFADSALPVAGHPVERHDGLSCSAPRAAVRRDYDDTVGDPAPQKVIAGGEP